MNAAKEKLIIAMIDCRLQNIRNNGLEDEWMADAMNFGWVGYDKYTDDELLDEAYDLGLVDVPRREELK